MREHIHTVNTETQGANSTSTNSLIELSGTNSVVFSLSEIDQTQSFINKAVVVFPDEEEQVVYREASDLDGGLSAKTFTKIIESNFDNLSTNVVFYFLRDDGLEDTHTLTIDLSTAQYETYTDINLIKCDFVQSSNFDNNLLLTFNTDDESLAGINLINFNSESMDVSGLLSKAYNFQDVYTENVPGSGEVSLEADTIFYNADRPLKGKIIRSGSAKERVTVKYRTRVPTDNTTIARSDGTYVEYIPAIPNTTFIHTSGAVVFHANSREQVKSFSVPVLDILGTNLLSASIHGPNPTSVLDSDNVYIKDYFRFQGISPISNIQTSLSTLSANYLYLDLFEISACDTTICSTCSTLTAYINY